MIWVVLTSLLAGGAAIAAPDPEALQVSIPSENLTDALTQAARLFGIQVIYDANRIHSARSPAVSGRLTLQDTLTILLKGTGFEAREQRPGTYVLSNVSVLVGLQKSAAAMPPTAEQLEAVIVTGSHIRGGRPTGAFLTSYDRDDFQRQGLGSVEDLGRQILPNFSGADGLATVNTNGNIGNLQQGAAANVFGGAGFDLLGLGPGATLTLLNGRRVAPGGLDVSLVDASLIPLSALERIDVVTDGASAIYGSDAVAGVVNLVTRQSLDGVETNLRYGRSTEGGAGHYTASQLLGSHWSSGRVLLDYEFDDEQGLDASARDWIGPQNGPYSLIPRNRRHSLFVSADQRWIGTDFSTSLLYSTRTFGSDGIALDSSRSELLSDEARGHANLTWATVSAGRELPAHWHVELTGLYSGMRQRRDGIEYADGLSGSYFQSTLVGDSDLESLQVISSGDVAELPAGMVRLSLGGGFQAESFRTSILSFPAQPAINRSRTEGNVFGEERLPLVNEEMGYRGIRKLEASIAIRYDVYSQIGSTRNPKIALQWEPVDGLTVRATDGTSFKAPLIAQLSSPRTTYTTLLPSSTPGGDATDAFVLDGGNQYLQSQRSRFITAGIDWHPVSFRGFRVSATYYKVTYIDRIQSQNIENQPLSEQPNLLTDILSGPPSLEANFDDPSFLRDGAGRGPIGVNAIIDNELNNVASTREQGLYLDMHLEREFPVGKLGAFLTADYLLTSRTQIGGVQFAPTYNVSGTFGEPLKLRAQSGVSWDWRQVKANLRINYASSYDNPLYFPAQRIGSWITEDAILQYSVPFPRPGVSVSLGVQNLADRRPPVAGIPAADVAAGRSAIPYDGSNASPVGRFAFVELNFAW